jgi:RNA polymerase sigma-70 factor, ECF subfamily
MKRELAEIEDHLLVMDAQDGDRKALEQLVRRWQKRLWQHAYRLTADPQAAWDVTQQSWLGILKGLRKLHDPARFKAWAYRITTNKAFDWIKKQNARKEIPIESIADPCRQEKAESGIWELLQTLDLKKRTVLCLYYYEQLNVAEISAALKIPKGTVKSRLANARSELKKLWQHDFGT